jgi:hypothetical protein
MHKRMNTVVKKKHGIKNLTLCDDNQLILYLSATESGSMHDKAMADEYAVELPPKSVLRQDLGFLGHHPPHVIVEEPFKKPKNKELSFSQKIYNKMLASTRVVIEHSNSGIKRLRMIKDTIRVHNTEFRDTVMVVACALHNFRTIVRSVLAHACASLLIIST